jgi:hypothetical protein
LADGDNLKVTAEPVLNRFWPTACVLQRRDKQHHVFTIAIHRKCMARPHSLTAERKEFSKRTNSALSLPPFGETYSARRPMSDVTQPVQTFH